MKEKLIQYQKPLLAAGLLVLLLVLYFYRHKIFKGTLLSGSSTTAVNTGSSASSSPTATENTLLQKGNKGEQVRQLQLLLNEKHKKNTPTFIPLLETDGIFGDKTEQMLLKYTNQSSITLAQLQTKLTQA